MTITINSLFGSVIILIEILVNILCGERNIEVALTEYFTKILRIFMFPQ